VKTRETIAIITDGTASTRELAEKIRKGIQGCRVIMIAASDFSGADILPADVFFFGCDRAHPPSFVRLEKVLEHINLAGRSCGLFSPGSEEAIEYLAGIVGDSELIPASKPLFASDTADIAAWIDSIILLRRT
jgi:hypothetical protein